MAKNRSMQHNRRKPQWFAPRQVYLRAGQDSQYVELSPLLQIGVAIGFGVLALWLLGASYGALSNFSEQQNQASLLAQMETVKQELRAATEEAAQVPRLEAALTEARAATAKAQQIDETVGLSAELDQTRAQLDDIRVRLSESKAEEASLQARLEARTAAGDNPDEQGAEEASSLHLQLEEAFDEIEGLQTERDEAAAKLVAATKESAAKDEQADRDDALLKAATEEIERLQGNLAQTDVDKKESEARYDGTIAELQAKLDQETAARQELENQVADLTIRLQENAPSLAELPELKAADDAEDHARAIAADLKEAELLSTIETLRIRIAAEGADQPQEVESEDVRELKEQLAFAETEIERMVRNGLLSGDDGQTGPSSAATPERSAEDRQESKRLKSELASAQADIIKLKADVNTAKRRLAEQTVEGEGVALKPDNTARLQQQLASTRSQVQQLNRALADAKLREVAIDLALINVVPSPSPPAPR